VGGVWVCVSVSLYLFITLDRKTSGMSRDLTVFKNNKINLNYKVTFIFILMLIKILMTLTLRLGYSFLGQMYNEYFCADKKKLFLFNRNCITSGSCFVR